MVEYLQQHTLCAQDIQENSDWALAPIAVTTNSEHFTLNYNHLVCFAKLNSQPIIRWRNELKEDQTSILVHTEEVVEKIYHSNNIQLFSYFVKGALAYLTEDINHLHQLANGTPVTMHHLLGV